MSLSSICQISGLVIFDHALSELQIRMHSLKDLPALLEFLLVLRATQDFSSRNRIHHFDFIFELLNDLFLFFTFIFEHLEIRKLFLGSLILVVFEQIDWIE